mmetsp:Transcript_20056/g.50872  ORF Transcript_20056/g.50872 Transcript_20056/m.50872 type:complete len:495 (-) Transcript_20056:1265-2749(-)|eukprot:CAMPEP_0202860318 /NCGR_PEP_ID=MMETSP1391-20130828/2076_1 /ASSEMBLY_ACC=CAM_ASM_000867 /TAXON_ID=1034604 /ORGANISM="Chlamydomonas leiostraca, Strain SAG 11-49" /LENGTH=494 /DNA_ID=CAMNT_0049539473 /DNA_START=107 /DNA_END=1591 /DNA_ORIENTATION=-
MLRTILCSALGRVSLTPSTLLATAQPQLRSLNGHGWRSNAGGGYLGTGRTRHASEEHQEEPRFLVTGACGQIGQELIPFLRARVGVENVVASDVKTNRQLLEAGPFVYLDVCDRDSLARIAIEHGVTHVIHLATLLSAVGERNPQLALKVNTTGIHNVLDLAAAHSFKVYAPSTIAVFGNSSPKVHTPNDTVMQPGTMYGVTKVHQELLGDYYSHKFGVDYRSLRYPGIISANAPPGGGTTDYAVDIFHQALKTGTYTCFLSEGAVLPMMYMPDCLEATWKLIMAPRAALTRTTYNVAAMSFSPQELAAAIHALLPDFSMTYTPDYRDDIAKTWPQSLDDSLARRDWGWRPRYDLTAMARDMVSQLRRQHAQRLSQLASQHGHSVSHGSSMYSSSHPRASNTSNTSSTGGLHMGVVLGTAAAVVTPGTAATAAVVGGARGASSSTAAAATTTNNNGSSTTSSTQGVAAAAAARGGCCGAGKHWRPAAVVAAEAS